jgi:hypothetical protein
MNGARIDADLVCARAEDLLDILQAPDPPPAGKWQESLVCCTLNHLDNGSALLL